MQALDIKSLKMKIVVALSVIGKSARAVSIEAGMGPDTLGKFLKGETGSLRADNLANVLNVLKISQDEIYREATPSSDPVAFGVRFGGVVEAGAFRPQNDHSQDDDYRVVPLPYDTRYPVLAQYAFAVMGDSMTRERIYEGMHVLAVDVAVWERLHGQPRDGQLVVVARARNGHPERELTVKKLRVFTDRLELQPCSDNPAYTPLVFPLPLREDAEAEAHIIAVVLSATWIYG
jgi:SOS-response transcriptional repressor LexA